MCQRVYTDDGEAHCRIWAMEFQDTARRGLLGTTIHAGKRQTKAIADALHAFPRTCKENISK